MSTQSCYKCAGTRGQEVVELFDYPVCTSCLADLGLYQDQTIKRQMKAFESSEKKNPGMLRYAEEIQNRLDKMDIDYKSGRIKLLHILERLEKM